MVNAVQPSASREADDARVGRWLVISHEASNSGAPKMLLAILRGMRARRGTEWRCEMLFARGGVLLREFAQLGPVAVLSDPWADGRSFLAGTFRRFVDRPWIQPRRLKRWLASHRAERYDLIYNNTATNGALVPAVRTFGCPILTHVHELACTLRQFVPAEALRQTLINSDHFLAVSPAVADDLVECDVPRGRITVTPNFLTAMPNEIDAMHRRSLRLRLGLPEDAVVVAGCGHIHGLKGPDLFVEMAAAVRRASSRDVRFVWIGGETDRRLGQQLRRRVSELRLDDIVRFVGAVEDPMTWFGASDLVAITSRVESFSLVALEAAALGRPVIGFAEARGLGVLLGGFPRLLVSPTAAEAMAAVVVQLADQPAEATRLGRELRARVATEFVADAGIKAIVRETERLIQQGRVSR